MKLYINIYVWLHVVDYCLFMYMVCMSVFIYKWLNKMACAHASFTNSWTNEDSGNKQQEFYALALIFMKTRTVNLKTIFYTVVNLLFLRIELMFRL